MDPGSVLGFSTFWVGLLASKPVQMRWIVNGTKDEFLLPDEMLDHALDLHKRVAQLPHIAATLSKAQREAIRRLAETIEAHDDVLDTYVDETMSGLVEADPRWRAIRDAAARVMRAFDLPIPDAQQV